MVIDYICLGIRIRKKREALRLSQTELAERICSSPQHISNVENGRTKISLEKITELANTFECLIDDLLCDSLVAANPIYIKEIQEVIETFSKAELRALPEYLRTLHYAYRLMRQEMRDEEK